MIFATRYRVLLGLGRDELVALCIGRRKGRASQTHQTHRLALSLTPGDQLAGQVARATEEISAWIQQIAGRQSVEVRWLVSDPWMHHRVFPVEQLPRSPKAQDALIRWRLRQELDQDTSAMKVAWTVMSSAGDVKNLYATALPEGFYQALCEPLLARGWPVAGMVPQLHALESANPEVRLGQCHLSLLITDEYWMSWRAGQGKSDAVRCRWFCDDPSGEALQRDIARAVNEEGAGSVGLFAADTTSAACEIAAAAVTRMLGANQLSVGALFPHDGPATESRGLARSLAELAGVWT